MMLVWFLGGFALYATLFALAGSLVSRQEDAQAAAAPIGYGLVAAYMLVFVFGYVPDSTASTVLSMLPPIAPFLMPMRMAAGAASTDRGRDRRRRAGAGDLRGVEAGEPHLRTGAAAPRVANRLARRVALLRR